MLEMQEIKLKKLNQDEFNEEFQEKIQLPLKMLYINNNDITFLGEFPRNKNITFLSITNNKKLKHISNSIENLENLTNLDISDNSLEKLPNITKLVNLRDLYIQESNITEIPNITQLIKLIRLKISSFSITKFPANFLPNIKYINIQYTNITEIPLQFYDLKNLEIFVPFDFVFSFKPQGWKIHQSNIPRKNVLKNENSPKKISPCLLDTWTYKKTYDVDTDLNVVFGYYNIHKFPDTISFEKKCRVINDLSPSKKWFSDIYSYYSSLSQGEQELIKSYTRGDDYILNNFYRNGIIDTVEKARKQNRIFFKNILLDILKELEYKNTLMIGKNNSILNEPFFSNKYGNLPKKKIFEILKKKKGLENFSDFFIGNIIVYSAYIFTRIFKDAPPLDRDILVFRGNETNLFIKQNKINSIGLLSTSNNPKIASGFIKTGYLWIIYVSKGTKCILPFNSMAKEESEVIFPHGTILELYDTCSIDKNIQKCEVELRENIIPLEYKKYLNVQNW
jgi:hypothetical protein